MTSSLPDEIKKLVKLEYDKGVAWVTINRPEKRNALSPNVSFRMLEIFDEVEAREDIGHWDTSEDYLFSKQEQLRAIAGHAREEGFKQFLDDKTYKPGLGIYKKPAKS